MAQDPLSTLIELNEITTYCDEAQVVIDQARAAMPGDQYFQLELDRKQTEIDKKRELVEILKFDIARRN